MKTYHSKIQEVKERADIVKVAEYFRLGLNRANKCVCPFHKEKTASFSISKEKQIFKCFGCDKSGDVISLVSELLHINAYQAAEQINCIFNLGVDFNRKTSSIEIERWHQKQKAKEAFKKWENETFQLLCDYFRFLEDKNDEETFQEIAKVEYYVDLFIYGTESEKLQFWKLNKKVVNKIAGRLRRRTT